MDDLIEAMTILAPYLETDYLKKYPTDCRHDVLYVIVEWNTISEVHKARLIELGFEEVDGVAASYKYGSN